MIVIVGVVLAVALAVLSYVRVSPSGISYRSSETWSNQATLILTQQGSPELRSILPSRPGGLSPSLADTGRFAGLVDVYAALATSDAVVRELRRRRLVKPGDLKDGALPISAGALGSTVNPSTPMMTITGTASTGPKATKLTIGATKAFLDVLNRRQVAAEIPEKDRVEARVLRSSATPTLVAPRKKAVPVLVLLGGLIATLALAFTRDNAARRARLPELDSADSRRAPDSSVDLTDGRSTLGPVPRPEPVAARKESDGRTTLGPVSRPEPVAARREPDSSIGVARRPSTLGSVPTPDPTRAADSAENVAQEAPQRRRARTSGRRRT